MALAGKVPRVAWTLNFLLGWLAEKMERNSVPSLKNYHGPLESRELEDNPFLFWALGLFSAGELVGCRECIVLSHPRFLFFFGRHGLIKWRHGGNDAENAEDELPISMFRAMIHWNMVGKREKDNINVNDIDYQNLLNIRKSASNLMLMCFDGCTVTYWVLSFGLKRNGWLNRGA